MGAKTFSIQSKLFSTEKEELDKLKADFDKNMKPLLDRKESLKKELDKLDDKYWAYKHGYELKRDEIIRKYRK